MTTNTMSSSKHSVVLLLNQIKLSCFMKVKLLDKAKIDRKIQSEHFWTSGTDSGCPSTFGWCASNKLVRGAVWADGMPGANDSCLSASVAGENITLSTNKCTSKLPYICEV
jgi:hypothetical protein